MRGCCKRKIALPNEIEVKQSDTFPYVFFRSILKGGAFQAHIPGARSQTLADAGIL